MFLQGTGWIPQFRDERDYDASSERVRPLLTRLGLQAISDEGVSKAAPLQLPPRVDLRRWFPGIENQQNTNACTAFSSLALFEYMEKRLHDRQTLFSKLFLYKVERNLLRRSSDIGAFLRTAIQAMVMIGAAEDQYWPFDPTKVGEEPPAFCYALARNYVATRYFLLDQPGLGKQAVLYRIKALLAAQLPLAFGFYIFPSLQQSLKTGRIPFPAEFEQPSGGHAIVACGYDDQLRIQNLDAKTGAVLMETQGAFLIRNSWGTSWGEDGYGWLPYQYLLKDMATDWWSIINESFIDTKQFGFGSPPKTQTGDASAQDEESGEPGNDARQQSTT